MSNKKFNVGDIVRAVTDSYGFTNKRNSWEGEIVSVAKNTFAAKTTKSTLSKHEIGFVYSDLRYGDFELVAEPVESNEVNQDNASDNIKKFNWNEFKNGRIAVHLPTQEVYDSFMRACDEQSIRWMSGCMASQYRSPSVYQGETCVGIFNALYSQSMTCCQKSSVLQNIPDMKIVKWSNNCGVTTDDEVLYKVRKSGDSFIVTKVE